MYADHFRRLQLEPQLTRACVSEALREVMRRRMVCNGRASPADFLAAANAVLCKIRRVSAAERRLLSIAIYRGARRFIASPLGRRLLSIDASCLITAPECSTGADVIVRDRSGRLHAVGITTASEPLLAGAEASQLVNDLRLAGYMTFSPVRVHLFSLSTGCRFSFDRVGSVEWPPAAARVA